MKDVIIRLFGKKRVPKVLQYDFLLPDIVILEIIAGLLRARSARGTEPHTHRLWSTSFRLVVT